MQAKTRERPSPTDTNLNLPTVHRPPKIRTQRNEAKKSQAFSAQDPTLKKFIYFRSPTAPLDKLESLAWQGTTGSLRRHSFDAGRNKTIVKVAATSAHRGLIPILQPKPMDPLVAGKCWFIAMVAQTPDSWITIHNLKLQRCTPVNQYSVPSAGYKLQQTLNGTVLNDEDRCSFLVASIQEKFRR